MPSAAQVSFDFSLGELGWREVYYWFGFELSIGSLELDIIELKRARLKWLSPDCRLGNVAVSELELDLLGTIVPNVFADAKVRTHGDFGLSTKGAASNLSIPRYAQMALWRLQNDEFGVRRSVHSRGIPSDWWGYDTTVPFAPPIVPAMGTACRDWVARLLSTDPPRPVGRWSIRGHEKGVTAATPFKIAEITGQVTPKFGPWIITVFPGGTAIDPGDQVVIRVKRRQHWARGLHGVQTVANVDGNVITLAKTRQNDSPIHYDNKGTIQLLRYRLYPIQAVNFVRYVVRDTGTPRQASRGKTKKRPGAGRFD